MSTGNWDEDADSDADSVTMPLSSGIYSKVNSNEWWSTAGIRHPITFKKAEDAFRILYDFAKDIGDPGFENERLSNPPSGGETAEHDSSASSYHPSSSRRHHNIPSKQSCKDHADNVGTIQRVDDDPLGGKRFPIF